MTNVTRNQHVSLSCPSEESGIHTPSHSESSHAAFFFTELMCCVFFFRMLRRCLFLLPNTLSSFIHRDRRRLLIGSRRHKSSYFKIVQRLRPNPNQLVSPNGKADSKERSQRKRADSKSDDSCNFHDLSSEACCPYID
jgi:hypothetical protein